MKKIFLLLFSTSVFCQIGINTVAPEGLLDINSAYNGLVIPRVSLVSTNSASPILNPQGGGLALGTMVFNTNTSTGPYGVIPGIYFWDGSKWISQFQKSFNTSFTQTSNLTLNTLVGSYNNIAGLTGNVFVAPYSGVYQIIFVGYLGGSKVTTAGDIVGYVEGYFKFTVNGIDNIKYSHSSSFHRGNGSSSKDYFELFNEVTIIVNVNLISGSNCTLNVSYSGEGDDNLDSPRHVVGRISGLANKCSINVTYIGR